MKILLVITELGVGGAERLVTNLADCFAQADHEVCLAYLYGEAKLLPNDPRVRVIKIGLTKNPVSFLPAFIKLRSLVRDFKPDVVNSHLVHANIPVRILRLIVPIPRLISSAHNTNEEGRFRMSAYRLTDRLADISTNVSDEAVNVFIEQKAVKPGRMIAMHNGIPIQDFSFSPSARSEMRRQLDISDECQLILAVGRLYEPKDYPNLLKAFSSLVFKASDTKLLIAGDGPLKSYLENMAAALGIADKISFLGIRHDVPALMSACDVFVLSSAWEGFGLVVGEAMASERVVVATDCGGVKEVIGDAGFLVPACNSAALEEALNKAIQLPIIERQKLGRLARARVESLYSLDVVAEKWLQLYQDKLSK
ncbi:glycosyltransferase [Methylobacter sp. Wu1]|uniref:glycosyltransferase n=1 Tax=Methylobacter sp. Wu1 TaxID=3119359 RepID=UPI002F928A9A